jgi:hypothetical protein
MSGSTPTFENMTSDAQHFGVAVLGRLDEGAFARFERVGAIAKISTGPTVSIAARGGLLPQPTRHVFVVPATTSDEALALIRPILRDCPDAFLAEEAPRALNTSANGTS